MEQKEPRSLTPLEAYARLTARCASAEHCLAEVRDWLCRWHVEANAVEPLLQRLVDERYIDEARYCRAFVRDKARFAHWGKYKIAQALAMKRIPESIYRPLLNQLDDEEDYLNTLRRLIEAKQRTLKAGTPYERKAKLIRFALGRGYSMEDISQIIPDFEENEADE